GGGGTRRVRVLARRTSRGDAAPSRRTGHAALDRRGRPHQRAAGTDAGGVAARGAWGHGRAEGSRGGGSRACGVAGRTRTRAKPRVAGAARSLVLAGGTARVRAATGRPAHP